jgi:hypothetical protein
MREREETLNIRTTAAEKGMLRALAEGRGISQSDYVRLRIRDDYAAKFGDKKPKAKRARAAT